jgi:hypothetical protein
MAARINWQDENGIVQHQWIERNVFRIGNRDGADISLNPESGQDIWIVMEYRGKDYVVHNRCEQPLLIDDSPLEPGAKLVWSPGSYLNLGDIGEYWLEVDGDSRPAPAPNEDLIFTDRSGRAGIQENGSAAPSKPSGTKAVNTTVRDLAITVMALIGFLFLMGQLLKPPNSGGTVVQTRSQIQSMSELRVVYEKYREGDEQVEELFSRIQRAFLQLTRSNHKKLDDPQARQEFVRIRDSLNSRMSQEQLGEDSFEYNALQYVLYLISRIDAAN